MNNTSELHIRLQIERARAAAALAILLNALVRLLL